MNPDSEGPIYCAEQIVIPAGLPDILKEFTKAAIRTQPADLLQWSAAYFQALAKGEVPPVKDRLEQSLPSAEERLGGLTKGALAVLHKQLDHKGTVTVEEVREKWQQIGCAQSKLEELLTIGNFSEEVEWQKFLALTCTAVEKTLPAALRLLCEILSPDPEGGAARVPLGQLLSLYSFLAQVDGEVSREQVAAVAEFLTKEANRYNGTIGPQEFLHPSCPRLDSALT